MRDERPIHQSGGVGAADPDRKRRRRPPGQSLHTASERGCGPERSSRTSNDGPSGLQRRDLLRGIAAGAITTGLAGCLGWSTSRDFAAALYGIPLDRLDSLEYGVDDFRTLTVDRSALVAGIDVQATVQSRVLRYAFSAPAGSDRPTRFGVLSTPLAQVFGRALNPVPGTATGDLVLGEALDDIVEDGVVGLLNLGPGEFVEWIQRPGKTGTTPTRILGNEAAVESFVGIGRSNRGVPHAVLVSVGRVQRNGDEVIVAAGRDRPLAVDESGEGGTEVGSQFTAGEVTRTVEAFIALLPELRELDPDEVAAAFAASGSEDPVAGFPEAVARTFAERVGVDASSPVYLLGPVPPGTTLAEPDPGPTVRDLYDDVPDPVTLSVPEGEGDYYVGVVDDMPGFKFEHPVRYAWVDAATDRSAVVDASWWPQFFEGGRRVTALFEGPIDLDGLRFNWVKGGSCTPCGDDGGTGTVNDASQKADAENGVPTAEDCHDRYALVVDLGETDPGYTDGIADEAAADADAIGMWLRGEGYRVQRISQYWASPHPAIHSKDRNGSGNGPDLDEGFFDILRAYGALFEECCEKSEGSSVEFFLYLNGHGQRSGVNLEDPTGNGTYERLTYGRFPPEKLAELAERKMNALSVVLAGFPECVAVTVFVDSCKSGSAVPSLQPLAEILRRISVITSCSSGENCPSGQGPVDSASEDFMQG